MSDDTNRRANRPRVAPHRRRPRRSFWRKYAWPVAKYGVLLTAVVVIGVLSLCKIVRPFRLLSTESREARRAAVQLAAIKSDNSMLERRIRYLKTQRGTAHAARKLGYVKPGEITLVVPRDERKPRAREKS